MEEMWDLFQAQIDAQATSPTKRARTEAEDAEDETVDHDEDDDDEAGNTLLDALAQVGRHFDGGA